MLGSTSRRTVALAGALGAAWLVMASAPLAAQQNPPPSMPQHAMPQHTMPQPAMPIQAVGPADQAYQAAMERMQHDMPMDFTGDADVDFVRGMIPHHQGAVDMAKAVLTNGSDPEIRKLAEAIIESQDKEIAFMRGWLTRKGQNPG